MTPSPPSPLPFSQVMVIAMLVRRFCISAIDSLKSDGVNNGRWMLLPLFDCAQKCSMDFNEDEREERERESARDKKKEIFMYIKLQIQIQIQDIT